MAQHEKREGRKACANTRSIPAAGHVNRTSTSGNNLEPLTTSLQGHRSQAKSMSESHAPWMHVMGVDHQPGGKPRSLKMILFTQHTSNLLKNQFFLPLSELLTPCCVHSSILSWPKWMYGQEVGRNEVRLGNGGILGIPSLPSLADMVIGWLLHLIYLL